MSSDVNRIVQRHTSGVTNEADDDEENNCSKEEKGPEDKKERKAARISKILGLVTLEPMLFVKMIAEGNLRVVADALEIDRVCRVNLNYSYTDCQAMDDGNHTDIQNDVQRYQNSFNYHQNIMDSLIPLLVILLVGPLSDVYGRKPAMISVLMGFIGFSVVYILTALNPTWPVQVLYLATFIVDVSGTWVVFNMAVYSYIADITKVENRTKRMGFADAIWYLGSPIGVMMGGYIYEGFGFVAVYAVSGSLWVLCLLYTIFFIKESRMEINENEELTQTEGKKCCGPFRHILLLFKSVFRRRSANGHIHIMVLIGLKLGVFLVQGHQMYLWARKVLQWDTTQYSTWSSLEEGSHQAGMVSWVWIGEKFHLHDCTVANGGLFSILLWSVTLACITGPSLWWLTILASFLGLLEASIEPAIRSMLTAIAGSGEEGKILAMLGILESLWLSVDRSIYTKLYNSFVDSLPQIDFIFQAGFAFILMIVVTFLKSNILKNRQQSHVVEHQNVPSI